LLAAIFVCLILISISTSEQQKDTAKISTDKDGSINNMAGQLNNMDLGTSTKNKSLAANNDDSFTSIFNGKNLDGWKMVGEGKFVIAESEAALQSEGGMGLLWYSENKYKNFILKLEWKSSDGSDNSGVFVRFPDPDGIPNNAVREGYEIQIDDNAYEPIHQTGAIYNFVAPSEMVSKLPGQWNTMEIQIVNQSYVVIINEQRVTEFTGNRMTEGHIGLQAHDDKSKVSFRNIMVKEI
jgi:3-keto-disaccharide hydrolase